jgi:hypothetical protein
MHTRFWWVNLERRRLLGSSRHRWECNIKGIRQGMEWVNVVWYRDKCKDKLL